MHPKRLFGLAAFVCSLAMAAQTADHLTIRVQDPAAQPVAGAKIELAGTRDAAISDADGEARIAVPWSSEIVVTVTAEGYFAVEGKRVSWGGGQPVMVAVTLHPASVVSETVVVTATGTQYAVQDAPIRTDLITHDLVDRQVKTTLAEAFQATMSGVRMEMNCQNCGFMQIRMNGLEGPYTQILEDGLPSYSGVTSVYGLEQIPAGFVDQIEVVKGGNSALYGPGAVAGVVNLIRREPRENRFRVDLLTGWHAGRPEQQAGASAQLAEMGGGWSGDFYYRGANRVAIDWDRDGFSDLGKRNLQTGGFALFRRFLDGNARFTVNGTIADEFRRGGDRLELPPHETWITEQIASRRYAVAFGWNHTLSPRTYYNARASHAYYGRNTYYGAARDPGAYGDTRNPLWVSDVQLGHQSGRHSLLTGYQLSWEHVEDNAPAYSRTYGGTFQNHGVYFQDEWRGSSRLTLIGGARIDKSNQLDRLIVSPRAGVKYGFGENVVWRATISTGFRAPAVFDEDLHIAQVGGAGFVLQNDPALREEKSRSATTGVDLAGTVFGRRYQFAANLFYTDLRHSFTLVEDQVPGHGFRRLLRVNGSGAHVAGLGFDGAVQLARALGVRAGFTLQKARWAEPEAQFGARDFFRTPQRYGFAGVDWDLPAKIDFTATVDYTGRMIVPHYAGFVPTDRLETSPRFAVLNAVVSRTFELREDTRLRLFFNLQNAGNSFQPDLDRGPSRDSAYVYGPAELRRAVLGLTWEF